MFSGSVLWSLFLNRGGILRWGALRPRTAASPSVLFEYQLVLASSTSTAAYRSTIQSFNRSQSKSQQLVILTARATLETRHYTSRRNVPAVRLYMYEYSTAYEYCTIIVHRPESRRLTRDHFTPPRACMSATFRKCQRKSRRSVACDRCAKVR